MVFEEFQLQITRWFEFNHNSFFDSIFSVFTELGDVTFLLFVFMFIYWNISKKTGLKTAFAIALSFGINTGIKESVKNLRPFYQEGITKGLSKEVTGFSFPSGHSQNSATLWTVLIYEFKNNWVRVIGVVMMIMIPLSRLYLRVHWLQDILAGVVIGIVFALVYEKYLSNFVYKFFTNSLVITFMTPISFFIVVMIRDPDVAKGLGVFAGIMYGYWFESKVVGYESSGTLKVKTFRFILGAVGLIGLQTILKLVFSEHIFLDYVRYYILGSYITFIAPYIFNKFKLR